MRRFWAWIGASLVALALAMAATTPTPLGAALWHYNAGFAVALAGAVAAWPLLRRRRFATMTMAFSGAVATATGFAMLYTKQFPFKEWITWWHSATSFALLLGFLVHWLHNNPRLVVFARRLLTSDRVVGYPFLGAWAGIAVLGGLTWTAGGRARFTSENYLYASSWAVLVGVAVPYGLWLAFRWPRLRARLAQTRARNRARSLVDTSLFLACWLALLTGFALLYVADLLRAGDLKYVSKWWHTATSVAFVALVVLHVGFNARLLAAHARRLDGDRARI
jgi:hypothetical protein